MNLILDSKIFKKGTIIISLLLIFVSYIINYRLIGINLYENLLTGYGPPVILILLSLYFEKPN
ncbi:hypothetical protein, partial [Enterococcus sp. RIT-PI-f]|uniref:hypothetical protein n=1 Tax=Enterococcus sp. RIT-PI-f TaxID=1690244 RepID=UPI000ADF5B68